jgi:hypothetical protein
MNTKKQSAIGISKAIDYYTNSGYSVFIPVTDTERYDLLVDTGKEILKVEVKTSNQKNGQFTLRTLGGNRSWSGRIKKLSSTDCDRVFLVQLFTGVAMEFNISELEGRNSITLK